MPAVNETIESPSKRLGKLPAKGSLKQLQFAHFVKAQPPPPAFSTFWMNRSPFMAKSFGNNEVGCCTIASQAVTASRMERIEQQRTIIITTDEVLRVYYNMTSRLYGGGDTGAYESDALSNWRKPDLTFRDTNGRPHTIDAFLKINHTDIKEVKRAIAFSGVHGVKVCFALPAAWESMGIPNVWDIPEKTSLIGRWLPNSWGGHSLSAFDYDNFGPRLYHTWYDGGREVNYGVQKVSWRAFLSYCDEAHIVIDSLNSWKQQGLLNNQTAGAIAEAVNSVSSQKIAT